MTLEDSTTYQLILNKGIKQGEALGRAAEAQRVLLLWGCKWFGAASAEIEAALRAITDRDHLDRLIERILDATGWDDLLATP